jgi:hypothetical protein
MALELAPELVWVAAQERLAHSVASVGPAGLVAVVAQLRQDRSELARLEVDRLVLDQAAERPVAALPVVEAHQEAVSRPVAVPLVDLLAAVVVASAVEPVVARRSIRSSRTRQVATPHRHNSQTPTETLMREKPSRQNKRQIAKISPIQSLRGVNFSLAVAALQQTSAACSPLSKTHRASPLADRNHSANVGRLH